MTNRGSVVLRRTMDAAGPNIVVENGESCGGYCQESQSTIVFVSKPLLVTVSAGIQKV